MTKESGFVPELGVKNVQSAINFYERAFGFSVVESISGGEGGIIWAEMGLEGARLMLQQMDLLADEVPGLAPGGNSCVHVLRVSPQARARELFECASQASATHTPIRVTDYGTTEFSVSDSDGHVLLVAGRD